MFLCVRVGKLVYVLFIFFGRIKKKNNNFYYFQNKILFAWLFSMDIMFHPFYFHFVYYITFVLIYCTLPNYTESAVFFISHQLHVCIFIILFLTVLNLIFLAFSYCPCCKWWSDRTVSKSNSKVKKF